jgi:hypothetical protein
MSDVRGKSATAMSRTKKPSKLSADERAFLNRIRSLNEEETENLSFDDIIAYLNILDKVDPGALRSPMNGPERPGRFRLGSSGGVASMSGLRESGHGWAIYEYMP